PKRFLVMRRTGESELDPSLNEWRDLRPGGERLAGPRGIAAPAGPMAILTGLMPRRKLRNAKLPSDRRKFLDHKFQRFLPHLKGRCRLRHPAAKDGLKTVFRFVDPIVLDLSFRKFRQDQTSAWQCFGIPREIFDSPKQAGSRTTAENAAFCRSHQRINLWVCGIEIFLDDP